MLGISVNPFYREAGSGWSTNEWQVQEENLVNAILSTQPDVST